MWAQYTPAYMQWHQGVSSDIKKITSLPTTSDKEQAVVQERLLAITHRIKTEQGAVCSVNSLLAWQQKVVSEYNNARLACQKMATNTVAFQQRLSMVMSYISDDQSLAKIITKTSPKGELTDETWANQVAVWNEAIAAAEKLAVSSVFKPTKQQAIDRMAAVKLAWQDVIAAHLAKDKGKYVAAYDKLATSYDGLSEIAVVSEKNLADISGALNGEFVKALN